MLKTIGKMAVVVPCLAVGLAPAARADWKNATQKKIHNQSGRTVTLLLVETDQPGRVGVGPYVAGLEEPEADLLVVPPTSAAAEVAAGTRIQYELAHGKSAGLYLDRLEPGKAFKATFRILDAAGSPLVAFRTEATHPDDYAWLQITDPAEPESHIRHDPHMILLGPRRDLPRRRSAPPTAARAGASLAEEAKAAGAKVETRRNSEPEAGAAHRVGAGDGKGLETKAVGRKEGASALRLVLPKAKPKTESKASS
jgi:hypothetical protein